MVAAAQAEMQDNSDAGFQARVEAGEPDMNWNHDHAVAEVRLGCEFALNPALPSIIAGGWSVTMPVN